MTLLIIGDGIQSGTEALVAFLERHGGLQFSFGLIEVAVFQTADGGRFVQPRVLAKTELMRRVLLVDTEGTTVKEALPEAATDSDIEPTWHTVFWTDFQKVLRLDDLSQPTPPKTPRGTNIFFPMPPSGSVAWVSAFVSISKKEVGVYLILSQSHTPFKDAFAGLFAQRDEIEKEVGATLEWQSTKSFQVTIRKSYRSLDDPEERQAVIEFLAEMTNCFVNAFRPRISALLRQE